MNEAVDPEIELRIISKSKQHDAWMRAALSDDHLAKVTVARDHNPVFSDCEC